MPEEIELGPSQEAELTSVARRTEFRAASTDDRTTLQNQCPDAPAHNYLLIDNTTCCRSCAKPQT